MQYVKLYRFAAFFAEGVACMELSYKALATDGTTIYFKVARDKWVKIGWKDNGTITLYNFTYQIRASFDDDGTFTMVKAYHVHHMLSYQADVLANCFTSIGYTDFHIRWKKPPYMPEVIEQDKLFSILFKTEDF